MLTSASTRLQNSGDDISAQWRALGSRSTALALLLFRNPVRSRGDLAAHASVKKHISESVLALSGERERGDMCAIFEAVFGTESVIDTLDTTLPT